VPTLCHFGERRTPQPHLGSGGMARWFAAIARRSPRFVWNDARYTRRTTHGRCGSTEGRLRPRYAKPAPGLVRTARGADPEERPFPAPAADVTAHRQADLRARALGVGRAFAGGGADLLRFRADEPARCLLPALAERPLSVPALDGGVAAGEILGRARAALALAAAEGGPLAPLLAPALALGRRSANAAPYRGRPPPTRRSSAVRREVGSSTCRVHRSNASSSMRSLRNVANNGALGATIRSRLLGFYPLLRVTARQSAAPETAAALAFKARRRQCAPA
jgi:hypothetical protein